MYRISMDAILSPDNIVHFRSYAYALCHLCLSNWLSSIMIGL
jgi:hypothetical protein